MFETVDDIYEHIGQCMINALPDDGWEKAVYYALIVTVDRAIQGAQCYVSDGNECSFNVNIIDDVAGDSQCEEAFFALYHIMQRNEEDVPWNKARFMLTPEGEFEIDFKRDEDYIWLRGVDPDSQEYDDLDIRVINQIKSWEGLPEDFPRYWREA